MARCGHGGLDRWRWPCAGRGWRCDSRRRRKIVRHTVLSLHRGIAHAVQLFRVPRAYHAAGLVTNRSGHPSAPSSSASASHPLRCSFRGFIDAQTLGVEEHVVAVEPSLIWRVIDVEGAKGGRHKWAAHFMSANMIIFVAAISDYDARFETLLFVSTSDPRPCRSSCGRLTDDSTQSCTRPYSFSTACVPHLLRSEAVS